MFNVTIFNTSSAFSRTQTAHYFNARPHLQLSVVLKRFISKYKDFQGVLRIKIKIQGFSGFAAKGLRTLLQTLSDHTVAYIEIQILRNPGLLFCPLLKWLYLNEGTLITHSLCGNGCLRKPSNFLLFCQKLKCMKSYDYYFKSLVQG